MRGEGELCSVSACVKNRTGREENTGLTQGSMVRGKALQRSKSIPKRGDHRLARSNVCNQTRGT